MKDLIEAFNRPVTYSALFITLFGFMAFFAIDTVRMKRKQRKQAAAPPKPPEPWPDPPATKSIAVRLGTEDAPRCWERNGLVTVEIEGHQRVEIRRKNNGSQCEFKPVRIYPCLGMQITDPLSWVVETGTDIGGGKTRWDTVANVRAE